MRILTSLLLLATFQTAGFGATWIYPDMFFTLQNAIDTVADGDVILVRPGTYYEASIHFSGRAITVRSDVDGFGWTHDIAPADTVLTVGWSQDIVTFDNGDTSTLEGFTITQANPFISGSAIFCKKAAPTILSNIITGNRATAGAGIYLLDGSNPLIANNVITENLATNGGGSAILCIQSSPTIVNNTITENQTYSRGAIDCLSNSFPTITNSIVYRNQVRDIYEDFTSNADVNYCCVSVWAGGGVGNFPSDPLFVDAPNRDFHILNNSPCRYSGNNLAAGMPDQDFEDDPRTAVGIVDVGADQFYRHLYVVGDTVPSAVIEAKVIEHAGTGSVLLYVALGTLPNPIPTQYGYWHLSTPMFGPFDIGVVSPEGLLVLPATLPPMPGPYRITLQALVGNRLTNVHSMIIQ